MNTIYHVTVSRQSDSVQITDYYTEQPARDVLNDRYGFPVVVSVEVDFDVHRTVR